MNDALVRALRDELDELKARQVTYRRGIITATSPLSVALGGSSVPYTNVKRHGAYTPTIGDQVKVAVWGNDLIVEDKIV